MSSDAAMDLPVPEMIGTAEGIALSVQGLSKCYHIYDNPRDRLKQFVMPRIRRLWSRQSRSYFREFWALRDVSFEVKRGEVVGIVGRNGSGKSTLLQLICGTLSPTIGAIRTYGRIAALLELGSGFNPEFTGRENVYLNAAVLGLGTTEIDRRFDDIAAFAEIGQFMDQPVKTYSSGMAVRLAFAVAINVDPEILVVDEALSVGDELFQRKCFARIEEIRSKGATILFVSHSGGAVIELCDRAVLLDSGEMLASGRPKDIIGRYQKLLYSSSDKAASIREEIRNLGVAGTAGKHATTNANLMESTGHPLEGCEETYDEALKPSTATVFQSHGAVIDDVELLTMDGRKVNGLVRGRRYRFRYRVRFERGLCNVRFGMLIKSVTGFPICGNLNEGSMLDGAMIEHAGKHATVDFMFDCLLNPGTYFMNAGVFGSLDEGETLLHRVADILAFRVLPIGSNKSTELVHFNCESEVVIDG